MITPELIESHKRARSQGPIPGPRNSLPLESRLDGAIVVTPQEEGVSREWMKTQINNVLNGIFFEDPAPPPTCRPVKRIAKILATMYADGVTPEELGAVVRDRVRKHHRKGRWHYHTFRVLAEVLAPHNPEFQLRFASAGGDVFDMETRWRLPKTTTGYGHRLVDVIRAADRIKRYHTMDDVHTAIHLFDPENELNFDGQCRIRTPPNRCYETLSRYFVSVRGLFSHYCFHADSFRNPLLGPLAKELTGVGPVFREKGLDRTTAFSVLQRDGYKPEAIAYLMGLAGFSYEAISKGFSRLGATPPTESQAQSFKSKIEDPYRWQLQMAYVVPLGVDEKMILNQRMWEKRYLARQNSAFFREMGQEAM